MKKIAKIVALVLIVAMIASLAACGGSAKTNLKFATGGETGTYYAFCGALSQMLTSKVDGVTFDVQATGGSKANIQLIDDGDNQIAIVQNDVMYYAYTGTDLFEGNKIDSFSAMGACYSEACQIIGAKGIDNVGDLKGKKVSVGDVGSGVEFNARQILAAYGLTFDDIEKYNLSFGDSADALQDGKIDAFFCTAGAPTTAVSTLATTNEISVVEVDDAHAEKLIADYPFYAKYTIPAGTYNGVDADRQTVTVKATLIVANSLSEDLVYKMTKALFENTADIGHAKAAEISTAFAVDGISIPFHPGAEKYYKEIGVL